MKISELELGEYCTPIESGTEGNWIKGHIYQYTGLHNDYGDTCAVVEMRDGKENIINPDTEVELCDAPSNDSFFAIKLIEDNGECNLTPGAYVYFIDGPQGEEFDFSFDNITVFSSLEQAELRLKNNCGSGFKFEIINLVSKDSIIISN